MDWRQRGSCQRFRGHPSGLAWRGVGTAKAADRLPWSETHGQPRSERSRAARRGHEVRLEAPEGFGCDSRSCSWFVLDCRSRRGAIDQRRSCGRKLAGEAPVSAAPLASREGSVKALEASIAGQRRGAWWRVPWTRPRERSRGAHVDERYPGQLGRASLTRGTDEGTWALRPRPKKRGRGGRSGSNPNGHCRRPGRPRGRHADVGARQRVSEEVLVACRTAEYAASVERRSRSPSGADGTGGARPFRLVGQLRAAQAERGLNRGADRAAKQSSPKLEWRRQARALTSAFRQGSRTDQRVQVGSIGFAGSR